MHRWRLAILAAAASLAGAALAQDAPPAAGGKKRHDLAVPTRWEAGETVTTTVVETSKRTATVVREGRPKAKPEKTERRLEFEVVVRCDEASPEGAFLRGRVHVAKWRRTATGEAADESVQGAHVERDGGAWKVVHGAATPSDAGRAWMAAAFSGADFPAWHSARERFANVAALAVGESAEVDFAKVLRDFPDAGRGLDAALAHSKITLVSADATPDGPRITVTAESNLPFTAGATGDGVRTEFRSKSRLAGVPARWHRTAEETFDLSVRGGMSMPGLEATVDETLVRTRRSRPGGKIPAIPAPAPPTPPPAPPGGK